MQRDGGPGGPGAGGNPTGGSFTGPAQALDIYGDFAAAYTGLQPASTTRFTVLSFTTGNYLFVGEFQLNAAIELDNVTLIVHTGATIKLNGSTIALLTAGDLQLDAPITQTQTLLIPAYTEVLVQFDMDSTAADRYATGSLIGRIYRG